ncbi:hypothetical protein D9M73_187820 [compost metagenome]
MARPAVFVDPRQLQPGGDLFEQGQLALVATELVLLVAQRFGMARGPGVFQVGAEGGVGQAHATVELVILQLGQHPQALGIALETEEVGAFGIAHGVQPAPSGGLLEPVADGILAGVAERRVADVVGQAGRLDDDAEVRRLAPVRQRVAQRFAHAHAQGAPDAAHFQ